MSGLRKLSIYFPYIAASVSRFYFERTRSFLSESEGTRGVIERSRGPRGVVGSMGCS